MTLGGAGCILLVLFSVQKQWGESAAALLVLPLIGFFLLLYIPFAFREHRARRRIRREQQGGNRELRKP